MKPRRNPLVVMYGKDTVHQSFIERLALPKWSDPLSEIFGKDIAFLIYRQLFQDKMKELSNEFRSRLVRCPVSVKCPCVRLTFGLGQQMSFNARERGNMYSIRSIWGKYKNLPKHYWRIRKLY